MNAEIVQNEYEESSYMSIDLSIQTVNSLRAAYDDS